MKEMTYGRMLRETMEFYHKGLYREAYDYITGYADSFPADRAMTCHMQLCMAGRMNDMELAIKSLQDFYDRGYWCTADLLREDEDLKGLQGNPEYEALVDKILKRVDTAMKGIAPELLVFKPEDMEVKDAPLLMVLHGNGQNARISENHWKNGVTRNWLLALPQSSQLKMPGVYNWMDIEKGWVELQGHYSDLQQQYGNGSQTRIIAGFSGGGRLALHAVLQQQSPFDGFLLVGPWLPELEAWAPLLDNLKDRGVRGYILVGDRDELCVENCRKLEALLKEREIPVQLDLVEGLDHRYPEDFEVRLEKALKFVCGYPY